MKGVGSNSSAANDRKEDTIRLPLLLGVFGAVSISMVVVNRNVMTALPSPCVVLLFQNGATVLINLASVRLNLLTMKPWSFREMKKFSVNALFMAASLSLNMLALPRVAVATLLVFKSLQVILSAWTETVLGTATFNMQAHACLAASFTGAVLYSSSDSYYNFSAYCIMLLWVVINVGGATYDKKATIEVDQTPAGCSCYKNLLSLPFLLIGSVLNSETATLSQLIMNSSVPSHIWAQVLLSGVLGFGISLCYSSLNKLTSATTITAANNFNKILTTIIGSQLYQERTSESAGFGLFFSMASIVVYGHINSKGKVPIQITGSVVLTMLLASAYLVSAS